MIFHSVFWTKSIFDQDILYKEANGLGIRVLTTLETGQEVKIQILIYIYAKKKSDWFNSKSTQTM